MVKTTSDVNDIPPIERMEKLGDIVEEKKQTIASKKKELAELEEKRKRDIEELEKKKREQLEELDQKKQELTELEKKKAAEIEETEDMMEKSFQDLMRHKRILLKEEDDQREERVHKTLEDTLYGATAQQGGGANYGKFFEELKVPEKLYNVTNPNFYSNLVDLRERALAGTITPEQEAFVQQLRERLEGFNDTGYLGERDRSEYIKRELNVIKDIDTSIYYR